MKYDRVFIKGDTHGVFYDVAFFTREYQTTKNDLLIILGDVGLNYFLDERDYKLKEYVRDLPITILAIHGNHEERPENIPTYQKMNWANAEVYYEEAYPNILFAIDGSNYHINDHDYFVLGGAYSIDKPIRIMRNMKWFESEEPSDEFIKDTLSNLKDEYDIILSHTCPYSIMPYDLFLKGSAQLMPSYKTEEFLEEVSKRAKFNNWYFGHFHSDRIIENKYRLVLNDYIEIK